MLPADFLTVYTPTTPTDLPPTVMVRTVERSIRSAEAACTGASRPLSFSVAAAYDTETEPTGLADGKWARGSFAVAFVVGEALAPVPPPDVVVEEVIPPTRAAEGGVPGDPLQPVIPRAATASALVSVRRVRVVMVSPPVVGRRCSSTLGACGSRHPMPML
ncbi:hypothetical protein GCM10027517_22280 [Phycicoccus ginsengisoli]